MNSSPVSIAAKTKKKPILFIIPDGDIHRQDIIF
jgi:hypothetical protein